MNFEAKIAAVIAYITMNGVVLNYAFYCANQKSNVWLAIGIVLGIIVLLVNSFLFRKLINRLEKKETPE